MSAWHGTFHRLHLKVKAAGSTVLSYATTALAGLAEDQLCPCRWQRVSWWRKHWRGRKPWWELALKDLMAPFFPALMLYDRPGCWSMLGIGIEEEEVGWEEKWFRKEYQTLLTVSTTGSFLSFSQFKQSLWEVISVVIVSFWGDENSESTIFS